MPTEVATRVKCPECGASVHVAEGATVTKCEYCGTESRVQRRSQFFQIPVRLPTPAPDAPNRVAVEPRTRSGWLVGTIVVAAFLVPIAIPVTIWLAQKRGVGDHMYWNAGMHAYADVDGDGYTDIIGYGRYVRRDLMRLNALSGKDGHTIWETDSLGTYTERYQDLLATTNGLVLRADTEKRALIEAFDAKTGAKKWSQPTAEVVARLCKQNGSVAFVTKDKRGWTFEPNSGALSPAVIDVEDCSDRGARAFQREERRARVKVDGVNISKVLGDHPPFIGLGTKDPGSRIPMIVALGEDDHVVWKAEVPGMKPLEANQTTPKFVAYDDKDIAVIYEKADNHQKPMLVEFDRATGQRRFEIELVYTGHMFITVEGIAMFDKIIFAMIENDVQTYDRATGKLMWTAGPTD